MKKIITAVFCTATALSCGLTVCAEETPEMLDRDYIEEQIWDDWWHGKGDDGVVWPEASLEHHILDQWLDENYGSDDYSWNDLGLLWYQYGDYYSDVTRGWDYNDDDKGNFTVDTEDGEHYSFTMMNGMWQMVDQNGNTVDTFPPFSTLEEEETWDEDDFSYEVDEYDEEEEGIAASGETAASGSADSARVVGVPANTKAATAGEPAAEQAGTASASSESAAEKEAAATASASSESNSESSGVSTAAAVGIGAGAAVIGGAAGFFIGKKKR